VNTHVGNIHQKSVVYICQRGNCDRALATKVPQSMSCILPTCSTSKPLSPSHTDGACLPPVKPSCAACTANVLATRFDDISNPHAPGNIIEHRVQTVSHLLQFIGRHSYIHSRLQTAFHFPVTTLQLFKRHWVVLQTLFRSLSDAIPGSFRQRSARWTVAVCRWMRRWTRRWTCSWRSRCSD